MTQRELVAEHLSVSFGGNDVVRDVSFVLEQGIITALVGANGCGKTSLLNCVSGFVPGSGKAFLRTGTGAVDLMAATPEGRALLGIRRTFQTPQLFPQLTLKESVALGCVFTRKRRWPLWFQALGFPAARREYREAMVRAEAALSLLHMQRLADVHPETLPLGQQRIAELARALVLGGEFVLLDEPFSGLNRDEQLEVQQVLHGFRGAGVGILLVEHNLEVVRSLADQVWVMHLGQIIARGDPQVVFDNPDVQKAFMGGGRR